MDEDELVDVVLLDRGPRAAGVYTIVHRYRLGELNIKQVRKLVDAAPQPVFVAMPRTQAEALAIEIEALGATVAIRAH